MAAPCDEGVVTMLSQEELTGPEQKLWRAVTTGEWVKLPDDTARPSPVQGGSWGRERKVRAELIVQLVTGMGPQPEHMVRMLRLRGAHIVGGLDFEGAVLRCPLVLDQCRLDRRVNLEQADAALIWLTGSFITAEISAFELHTHHSVSISGSICNGRVNFTCANIGGLLDCSHARFNSGIELVDAHIGGELGLSGAYLSNTTGYFALAADGIKVDQNMTCSTQFTAKGAVRKRFTARGSISLIDAHIGGSLIFSGANLVKPKRQLALAADRLIVDKDIFFDNSFTAHGQIELTDAQIGGALNLSGAHISGAHISDVMDDADPPLADLGFALVADGIKVGQEMTCEDFTAEGHVSLINAHIGQNLSFKNANLDSINLGLKGLEASEVRLGFSTAPKKLDLTHAQIRVLADDSAVWPVYITIEDEQDKNRTDVQKRLTWLRRHPLGYRPQPYEQLAAVYRAAGENSAVRKILIGKQEDRRAYLRRNHVPPVRVLGRFWDWFLNATIGYGYRPLRILLWLAALVILGAVTFDLLHASGLIRPKAGADPQEFHAVLYALDLLFPLAALKHRDGFIAQGQAVWWVISCTLAGWLLGAILVAGLSGVFKRD
jgi:hypothetical protein